MLGEKSSIGGGENSLSGEKSSIGGGDIVGGKSENAGKLVGGLLPSAGLLSIGGGVNILLLKKQDHVGTTNISLNIKEVDVILSTIFLGSTMF